MGHCLPRCPDFLTALLRADPELDWFRPQERKHNGREPLQEDQPNIPASRMRAAAKKKTVPKPAAVRSLPFTKVPIRRR